MSYRGGARGENPVQGRCCGATVSGCSASPVLTGSVVTTCARRSDRGAAGHRGFRGLAYLTPPSPIYPARSRRAGEKGTVTVKVLIDATGRPTNVVVQASSGHSALDESAVSAVRAARFRPYSEGGVAQPVWVLVPINFVLQ